MSGINIPAPAVLQDRTKPSDHKYNQKEVGFDLDFKCLEFIC